MHAYYWGRKCYQDFIVILTTPVQALLSVMHQNHTSYLVCSHGSQHICFNLTYSPQEQWLEIRSLHRAGERINHTRVSDPNEPVSMYFDVCAAIAKNTAIWDY
jgi:hypothetical protein